MIRIKRVELDTCIDAFVACAQSAMNTQGLRILFPIERRAAEAAVLGALSIVAPLGGPATADDVYFVSGFGTDDQESFPKQRVKL